ncbi:hypothetical protein H6P81_016283 [Aristolochia fimbriata]|uniref:Reverse transcriptase domain-containing protein n=1 Tax=Aristolochia fimbriata TaxID=158543 RepID=A0AAV7E8A7_ARIFI|nr:hypothetical protein H6P81_016283 [Aristolochia fimbriata]
MTRSRGTQAQEIDSGPERTLRQRLKENQNQSNPREQEEMEPIEGANDDQAFRPRRTMEDFVTQSPNTNRTSIITPSIQANNFDFKPQLLLMLQTHYQFNGLANEDPNDHLERFLDLCATFKYNGVSDDAARLRLFKFTLGGRAKTWLNTLPAGSIATWEDLQKKFLGKYFPPAKTIKLRNEIFQFSQESEEHLSEAWERFNGLLKRCPNHKIELWSQIEIFYNGLNINTRSMIDAAAGGSINKKTPEEVYELIEEMIANMYSYPMERSVKKPAGIYKLDSSTATQAQLEALQRQFANFQQQSSPVVASICGTCVGGHANFECQGNVYALNSMPEQTNFVGNSRRMDPYSNTYNPGWKNHPNFSWNNANQSRQNPPGFKPLQSNTQPKEETQRDDDSKLIRAIYAELQSMKTLQTEVQSIKQLVTLLTTQVNQLNRDVYERPRGALPSNSEINPKEQVKAITLRSGKTLEEHHTKEQPAMEAGECSRKEKKRKKKKRYLKLGEPQETGITLQFADRSTKIPEGVMEDVLVKIQDFIYPCDFVVLDMEVDKNLPIILGRPFLATAGAIIDCKQGNLTLRLNNDTINFNIREAMKQPAIPDDDFCLSIDVIDSCVAEIEEEERADAAKEGGPIHAENEDPSIQEASGALEAEKKEELAAEIKEQGAPEAPKSELKPLPSNLKYVFLEENDKPVIISSCLTGLEEKKLIEVLSKHKKAIGWSLADIEGISPTICTHRILMEDNYKPSIQPQRRLNPTLQEVVKKEVIKLLDAGIIYPISDSAWVSPVQVVPKKGGTIVIHNEHNELIPTRTVTGWRVCIDYRKLNAATRKDHFPLPFIDQMLERLAGNKFYYFLDGYSGYFQIPIAPEDQEKTTFTCPYGTFAYRRMPFGLCNAPATFQRCMMALFHDMIGKMMEIFMDDLTIYGLTFETCLQHLELVLERCEEKKPVLNWEKCHFMVRDGIVLGHKISENGIEVDKAKIEVIEKLPPPTPVKEIRSFLGHAGFYRRFIKDFSKIAKPLSNLLSKDVKFDFNTECLLAFDLLKQKLISAPIIVSPDWNLPFELMCDASDFALGAALG